MTEPHATSGADDHSERIIAALQQARDTGRPVTISGGGSKRHIAGRDCEYDELDVSGHRGIVDYQPQELVITARGGTPLSDIIATLQAQGQTLSFEPPLFDGTATVGGTLACNLSGPGRPWGGSIRDSVLGVQLINGKCERLSFGGKVMKNVAGYDVTRLQAGALGTLGVLSEVSLKVVPRAQRTLTLRYEMPVGEAIECMNRRAGEPKPLSGAFWLDGQLHLRLSGATSAVEHTAVQWGGEVLDRGEEIWEELREMTLPFFSGDAPLWRFSVKSTAPVMAQSGSTLIDWCGSQRWVRGERSLTELDQVAQEAGGHVTLYRGGDRSGEIRSPLNAIETALQQRLKQSFDPDGILNPGRLYSWL
jgi:glycolate oxidase FAD binding subunit